MAGMPQDFRFGVRALRSAPGFSIVAIAALALGIGATSAIVTLLYGVMIRPLPFPDPDRIVTSISTREMRGIRDGGVGTMIADHIHHIDRADPLPHVEVLGVPTRFIPQGKPDKILAQLGLDANGVASTVRELLA